MTSSLPGVNEELAAAIRRVNARRASLPSPQRPEFDERGWLSVLGRIDRARTASGALAAVAEWEQQVSATLTSRLLHAPLEDRSAA